MIVKLYSSSNVGIILQKGCVIMENKIVLVTGMSGPEKSSAMNAPLEDLGYYCMDNFPKELLNNLEDLLEKMNSHYKNVALGIRYLITRLL